MQEKNKSEGEIEMELVKRMEHLVEKVNQLE